MHCIFFQNVSTAWLSLLFRVHWFSRGSGRLPACSPRGGPLPSPRWRTQIATLTLCSRIAEGCSRSTQARYGVKSPPPRHHRYSHPRDASGQLKHWTMPAQLVTSQQADVRNTAVAYASVSFSLSDVTRRFLTGSAVGRYGFLWWFYLDKFKLRGSDHLQRQVSCSFPLDLRGDSRLFFFFFLFFLSLVILTPACKNTSCSRSLCFCLSKGSSFRSDFAGRRGNSCAAVHSYWQAFRYVVTGHWLPVLMSLFQAALCLCLCVCVSVCVRARVCVRAHCVCVCL